MSKTTLRKGKQDDKFSLAVRDIQMSTNENRRCFDCDQRGPTYVNMTIGSFVCTKCSGMLRGINPPHRIKSISMSTFTPEEVEAIRSRGNAWCFRVWLGTYDRQANPIDYKDEEKIKEFIIAKYERKRYYVEPSEVARTGSPSVSSLSSTSSQEAKPPLSNLIGSTLKASISGNQSNISVSRPSVGSLPRSHEPAPPVAVAFSTSLPQQQQQHPQQLPPQLPPQQMAAKDAFADFANFDSVAFDSLPADPLATPAFPPAATLPPTKAQAQVAMVGTAATAATTTITAAAAAESKAAQDRYSALKELDELFKSTSVSTPGQSDGLPEPTLFAALSQPAPTAANPSSSAAVLSSPPSSSNGGGLFGGGGGSGLMSAERIINNGSPAFGRNSPAVGQWGGGSAGGNSTAWGGAGGTGNGWGGSGGSNGAVAAAGWGGTSGAGGFGGGAGSSPGWPPASPAQQGWGGGAHPSNPFGTSPSAASSSHNTNFHIPENNNDLFAAAPKPFLSDRQGDFPGGGNPWSAVPAFTSNMTPAPNPHNPFL